MNSLGWKSSAQPLFTLDDAAPSCAPLYRELSSRFRSSESSSRVAAARIELGCTVNFFAGGFHFVSNFCARRSASKSRLMKELDRRGELRTWRFSYLPPCAKVAPAFFGGLAKDGTPLMTTPSVGVERRVGQRFPYLLPLSLRQLAESLEGVGFTQDLSSRGVCFFTDAPLTEGAEIEITLRMPSEITLGESMPVRCRGRILRVIRPSTQSTSSRTEAKIGVAVRLEGYEYLTESSQSSTTFPRVSSLHSHHEEERPMAQPPA